MLNIYFLFLNLHNSHFPDDILVPVLKVMGVMLMGFGLHSHFQSGWNKKIWVNSDGKLTQLYHVCKLYKNSDLKCPGISKERFFVSMVIIHFFVSIASLVLTVLDKTKENVKIKWGVSRVWNFMHNFFCQETLKEINF